ncbi:MAG TPA: hypothetical protein VGM06_10475 [Polyangiaceae bacterium]|jgi:hypothetical protein
MIRIGVPLALTMMLACAPSSETGARDAVDSALGDATTLDASDDVTTLDASTDARDGAHCPPNVPCGCVCPIGDAGGDCVCENFSEAYCPVPLDRSGTCPIDSGCMGCSQGAGFACVCSDAGVDATGGWICFGTEYSCTGGTPF